MWYTELVVPPALLGESFDFMILEGFSSTSIQCFQVGSRTSLRLQEAEHSRHCPSGKLRSCAGIASVQGS